VLWIVLIGEDQQKRKLKILPNCGCHNRSNCGISVGFVCVHATDEEKGSIAKTK
jgi:hypothetical protein